MHTLYIDFIIDGSSSMYTIFPAVYYAISHLVEAFVKYSIHAKLGMTIFRNEKEESAEYVEFDKKELFTESEASFLKKLRGIGLYGGGEDGRESVHTAIRKSLEKFPGRGRNRAIFLFTDAYSSDDYGEYESIPLGEAVLFVTDELAEEDFRFCFLAEDGDQDEEASHRFISLKSILNPVSSDLLEELVKPLRDLVKGVTIEG